MPNYLIVSPNGYGNVGDDICAYSGEFVVREILPNAKTIVTSPPFRKDLAYVADGIILSGGGILYDRSPENVENYMQYIDFAQQHNKKSVVLGVGVQGIVTDEGKKRYKKILNRTDLVTVRSEYDKRLLDEIGVKNVIATQDMGFFADEYAKVPFLKPRTKDNGKPKLGLILNDVRHLQAYKKGDSKLKKYIDIVEANIAQVAKDFDVYLFAHSKDDESWRNEMSKQHNMRIVKYATFRDFNRFFYLYNQMDLIVGLRFHSIILGLLAKKPVVGIASTNAKIFRLAESSATLKSQCYSLGDTDKLDELFRNLRVNFDKNKFKSLPDKELAKLKSTASQNKELLKGVLV
jgi:polysaccharide pyruvyl transferase WcaK-like protein